MATWKLSPQNKKSAVEQMFFYNDGKVIIVEQGWRWGTFTVESDERPLTDSELVNAEGYELGCIDNDECWELSEMTDGCWLDVTAGRDATEQDVAAFEQAAPFFGGRTHVAVSYHGSLERPTVERGCQRMARPGK